MIFDVKIKTQPLGVGKNNYIVLKNGMHVPRSSFKKWKKQAYAEILEQKGHWKTWSKNCKLKVIYNPRDHYKRDATAILDAVFHILEEARVITNDNQIKQIDYQEVNGEYDFCLYIRLDALEV